MKWKSKKVQKYTFDKLLLDNAAYKSSENDVLVSSKMIIKGFKVMRKF